MGVLIIGIFIGVLFSFLVYITLSWVAEIEEEKANNKIVKYIKLLIFRKKNIKQDIKNEE